MMLDLYYGAWRLLGLGFAVVVPLLRCDDVRRRAAQWSCPFSDYHWDYRVALDNGLTHTQALDLADACARTSQEIGFRVSASLVIAAAGRLAELEAKR
jgi:hypothetical protein